MSSVLVGMFDSKAAAEAAHTQLLSAGFSSSAVSMTGGSSGAMSGESTTASVSSDRGAVEEKGGIARFFDNLFGDDDNDVAQERGTYAEAFNRGSYGVSVTAADDSELDRAERVLNDAGALDIDEKASEWRKSGWTGGTAAASTLSGAATSSASGISGVLEAGDTRKLQEVEEQLKVGKRAVARGGVRIFTRIVERPVEETVRLREEHANVTRTAVDRPATEADFAAFKEGSIEVREMAEEAVVSKTSRVTGEVEIGKTATEREETIRETVRETKVDVEQIDAGSSAGRGGSLADRVSGTSASSASTLGGDPNRDPLSGEPGSHPVGTGIGAAAGGIATGAAIGTVAGPVGTVVGAAVGAVAGGLAGKGVAETIDPTTADEKSKKRL